MLYRAGIQSRYSDSLRAERPRDRIAVGGGDFTHSSRPVLGPTQPPILGTGRIQHILLQDDLNAVPDGDKK